MRIALIGYARTGKDEVGKILVNRFGLTRVAFGDLIKADLDSLVRKHLGFSAFTEDDAQKNQIRGVLVHWGYANFASLERRLYETLPVNAVNTRIVRLAECHRWRKAGGVIWWVRRPGKGPAEPKEAEELKAVEAAGLIERQIINMGSLAELEDQVVRAMDAGWKAVPV
jgi:hypothetical protein